jgi:DNA-binding transcriptional ArsR family regulator
MAYDLHMPADAQLGALSDPTRRRIVELLRRSPSSVRQLTDRLPVSQPAVSQHLKVLRQAQLVRSTPHGASNLYAVDPRGLAEMRDWLESMWDEVLDAFTETAITPPKERSR